MVVMRAVPGWYLNTKISDRNSAYLKKKAVDMEKITTFESPTILNYK